MTRKAFVADVAAAASKNIPGVIDVVRGDDDGEVNLCFVPSSGEPIEIAILATDIPGYPSENTYFMYTRSPNVPGGVNEALEKLQTQATGKTITDVLPMISRKLQGLLATGSQTDPLGFEDGSDVEMGTDNEDSEEEDYIAGYSSDETHGYTGNHTATNNLGTKAVSVLNRRIRQDLRAAKLANFKIGILVGMTAQSVTSIVSISVHVSKLGLSEEAMQAWDLEAGYVILLIKYSAGYRTFDAIISDPAKMNAPEFRIGVGNNYKPTRDEALAAFTEVSCESAVTPVSDADPSESNKPLEAAGFNNLFISSSLNDFMNTQFISLLKIRNLLGGVSWETAKRYFNDNQGRLDKKAQGLDFPYVDEPQLTQDTFPDIVSADHFAEATNDKEVVSFPLISAQFALRYLIRCTEFCLVCHDKIGGDFEALKPYVCSKPLCLYQYMSLGFGPSVEHEILTQPYVVDLLISFCYASVRGRRLRDFPTGMNLSVPPMTASPSVAYSYPASLASVGRPSAPPDTGNSGVINGPPESISVQVDLTTREVIFEKDEPQPATLQKGRWVVINVAGSVQHCRVKDASLYPTIQLSDVIVTRCSSAKPQATEPIIPTPATPPPPPSLVSAKMTIYDQSFDDIDDAAKSETIQMLIETLPSIKSMRTYLTHQSRTATPSLRTWTDRISDAALGLLRWIIASNRSCIVQVDKCPGQTDEDVVNSKIRLDQKISNVPENWIQFRLAQGSPDKEQRFLNALKEQQANLNPKYPTLVAFHGSPIGNWHSIIRHGLDFKETLHGRAYGHGVYHSQDQNICLGYALTDHFFWPLSELQATAAMSLNEIINHTAAYTSKSPYLVVQHVDWIQCRYLLVQTQDNSTANGTRSQNAPVAPAPTNAIEVEQDPSWTCRNLLHKPIGVPASALSISRAFRFESDEPKSKKPRTPISKGNGSVLDEFIISDDEDVADLAFLCSDVEVEDEADTKSKGKGNEKAISNDELVLLSGPSSKALTDFVPNSLDQSSLPMLEQPAYATTSATLTLNRELQKMLKVQKATPLHELGWYINKDNIENVYQWIVELHSFDPDLPLAKDMKKAGITSVVLEIRFGKDYPISPPFVRVIRPRFLPFMHGGGGHVTAGGAMCMELLTNSGWSAVTSLEAVLLQVRMAVMNLEPRPARLEIQGKQPQRDYYTGEAVEAYIRACHTHGWEVPKDFKDFA